MLQLLRKLTQGKIAVHNPVFSARTSAPLRRHLEARLEARLFSKAADCARAASLADARVLMMGFSAGQLFGLRKSIQSCGVKGVDSIPSVQKIQIVSERQNAFSHVVVNFDAFESTECGIDALLIFRMQLSEIVVILCSAFASGDDFGTERAAICDATLLLPVSEQRLRTGLIAGTENHADRHCGYGMNTLS